MRILALITDAFGGHGGIAKFNRDLLSALSTHADVGEIVVLPRIIKDQPKDVPNKVKYETQAANSKVKYIWNVLRAALRLMTKGPLGTKDQGPGTKDQRSAPGPHLPSPISHLLICGHPNLLPLAALAKRILNSLPSNRWSLMLVVHGIEAWKERRGTLLRRSLKAVDSFISVSEFTKNKFTTWSKLDPEKGYILPNCIDLETQSPISHLPSPRLVPGSANPELIERYGLKGRKVLMTLARLSAAERYKGIDEVLEIMPRLLAKVPNLTYLICGDGDDRKRLIRKANDLGLKVFEVTTNIRDEKAPSTTPPSSISDILSPEPRLQSPRPSAEVIFTGRVSEEEKAEHYRLADTFVMAGWGEGFGIVYLEAMACGIPVVASRLDASQEAVRNGDLGTLVDPKDPNDLMEGITKTLNAPKGRPSGLDHYSCESYNERMHEILGHVIRRKQPQYVENGGRLGRELHFSTLVK